MFHPRSSLMASNGCGIPGVSELGKSFLYTNFQMLSLPLRSVPSARAHNWSVWALHTSSSRVKGCASSRYFPYLLFLLQFLTRSFRNSLFYSTLFANSYVHCARNLSNLIFISYSKSEKKPSDIRREKFFHRTQF